MALARELGVLDLPGVSVGRPSGHRRRAAARAHDPSTSTRSAGRRDPRRSTSPRPRHGRRPDLPAMHEASALVAGATSRRRAVQDRAARSTASTSPAACTTRCRDASGFCIYNDPAIAIAWLLDQGVERVAYVDIDVAPRRRGQAAFWDDPRVLTISLHESGRTCFPAPAFRTRSAARMRRARRQRRAAAGTGDAAGCVPSTPSYFRCCARSRRRYSSPSTVATPTRSTRWPTCSSSSTDSGRRTPRCTSSRTRSAKAAGSRPAAGATSSSRSCRAPGPTSSPRPPARRSTPTRDAAGVARLRAAPHARARTLTMTDGADARMWRPWAPDGADGVDRAIRATRAAVFRAARLRPADPA